MGLVLTISVIVIAINCFSIEGKLKKQNEQNKEIIELLQQLKEKE